MLEIEHQIKKHERKKSENRQTKVQREINEEKERGVGHAHAHLLY